MERPPLAVLRASAEELADHVQVLKDIVKATKGACLWLPPEPEAAAG
jgi:DNA polymerase-3 subunit epsilon